MGLTIQLYKILITSILCFSILPAIAFECRDFTGQGIERLFFEVGIIDHSIESACKAEADYTQLMDKQDGSYMNNGMKDGDFREKVQFLPAKSAVDTVINVTKSRTVSISSIISGGHDGDDHVIDTLRGYESIAK
jgi:hypothetical protein